MSEVSKAIRRTLSEPAHARGCIGRGRLAVAVLTGLALATPPPPSKAQVCEVPASRPTIQAAVSDVACSSVVIAAGFFDESVLVTRTVTLQGAGATNTRLTRPLRVVGTGTALAVADLAVEIEGDCYAVPFEVALGATVSLAVGAELVVPAASGASEPCALFDDGFESGTIHAWSGSA